MGTGRLFPALVAAGFFWLLLCGYAPARAFLSDLLGLVDRSADDARPPHGPRKKAG